MTKARYCSWSYLLAALALLLLATAPTSGALGNPENDPDLAKALEYDSEYNGGFRLDEGQRLAEKYYLRYLERATDSAQRAKVYVQLGVLFSTNYHKEKGEKPDWAKSRRYMRKALEEEPERVGRATLRARLFLATPDMTPEERLRVRIDAYKWMSSLDEKTIRERTLPNRHGKRPTDYDLKGFFNLLPNVLLAESTNIPREATSTDNPIASLRLIIAELPGTKAAEVAQQKLNELVNKQSASASGTLSHD